MITLPSQEGVRVGDKITLTGFAGIWTILVVSNDMMQAGRDIKLINQSKKKKDWQHRYPWEK